MPSIILSDNGVSSGSAGLKSTAASDGALALQTTTAGGTATTAVYVDTSQNVGLGTSSPVQKQHLDGGAGDTYLQFSNSTTGATSSDGSRIGIASADTTLRIQNLESGSIRFDTAGSERMRLDANGKLLVGGTTSDLSATTQAMIMGSGGFAVQYTGTTGTYFKVTPGAPNGIVDIKADARSGNYPDMTFSTSATERMRIDSSGVLAIGTTSGAAATRLVVQGSGTGSNTLATFKDSSANTLMMVSENGNLLLMTTSSSLTADVGIKFINGSAGNAYMGIVNSSSINGNANYHLYSTGAGAYRFYVGMGGTIYATSTSISALSDQTLKTNIRDLETGLTEVMALKPRRFDWINGDATNVAGFVAQEVEQVLPELVTDYIHNKDEEGNDIIKKSLKMGDILPTLVKAIQELKAELDTAKEQIAALKGTQP